MDNKEFIVKMFQYINGELQLLVKEFDKIEDAIAHGLNTACESFKIFDRDGCCHHDSRGHSGGEYC
jgi:hypothetical protein